ncbi:hypothetical protein [Rhizobium phaseoli]|uniref:hypothetical protein n=1 Tax=Rhizobium phaseoli TaxID=396 RepID=UPI001675EC11|nr:hypothetical protein [Rhizobium phaseoli]
MQSTAPPIDDAGLVVTAPTYLSVGFVAGSIIALQIAVMRVFAVGSWTHFGSLVIGLAMVGFSLSSVVIFIFKEGVERHWRGAAAASLYLMGPLAVASNLLAQQLPFNAIFIVSEPDQKWRLFANFVLYLLPFLSGAFFLGIVFLKSRGGFNRVYFADLTGSGLAGLLMLGALYVLAPESIIAAPLMLWAAGAIFWFIGDRALMAGAAVSVVALLSIAGYLVLPGLIGVPAIAVTPYKGVSYARNFPDAARIYRSISPFGDLQVYKSSYMHFAPGLSDNAAFNVPEAPPDTYVGLYVDGEGPEGMMRELPPDDAAYYYYLPAFYPYVLKTHPKAFVVELGGGISTMVALHANPQSITVAESNPAILSALRDRRLKDITGNLMGNPALRVIDGDGRLYLAHTAERYDVIDLSLADSVGLSNPGGFAIVEKYAYTLEALLNYIGALADGGILSVTLWNKEEPPKSVLKFYDTMAEAAKAADPHAAAQSLFVASSYLSTTTVLYKKGGFSRGDIAKLRDYTRSMSFDEVYSPGLDVDSSKTEKLLADYRASIFGNATASRPTASTQASASEAPASDDEGESQDAASTALPSTTLGRLAWHALLNGDWPEFARGYVFDISPLTSNRPYFAGYEKFGDLAKTLDRLDLFQDDWGYLVLWATLGVAALVALSLTALPLAFRWRLASVSARGKFGTIVYFACLGLGFIMVEVGLISRFTLALANPTISASILISCLLVFSGLGSLVSERIVDRSRTRLPFILFGISFFLVAYASALAPVLDWIGGLPYGLRLAASFVLVAPPAFLMGFPMAAGMVWLARLGKDHLFVWAWGINGCFSVVGAAMVPIIATSFGLRVVFGVSAAAYLLAIPAFFSLLRPADRRSCHGVAADVPPPRAADIAAAGLSQSEAK